MIAKRNWGANSARRGAAGAAKAVLPLAALLLGAVLGAAPARAQASKLADGPAPPPGAAGAAPATPTAQQPSNVAPDAVPNTPDAAPADAPGPPTSYAPDLVPRKPAGARTAPSSTRTDPSTSKPTLRRRGEEAAAPDANALPDPLHAKKSLEVGDFYMKKGEVDAAIDRYEEAARLDPKLARPYLLLGEAYEKKSDASSAVTAYRKYLEIYSTAPDRDRILKRIERLEGKSPS